MIQVDNLTKRYGPVTAIHDVSFTVEKGRIVGFLGPNGAGKSTTMKILSCFMPASGGTARVAGYDVFSQSLEVRRRIGMVFQKANPFPKSIYDNIAFGPRITGMKGDMDQLVESCLRRAALWNEVQDKLDSSGLALSGGQQQRLCIARAIATEPDMILMDEPCSALDPRSTLQIEELMAELKEKYTIIIVTHNMQQAARASDFTVFLNMDDDRAGYIVEQGPTAQIFTNPKNQMTEDYVSGRFG